MATKEKPSQLLSARGFASVALHVDLTPAGWPKGGTLLAASGPCLSRASWAALQSWRPSSSMRPEGASMVLATFAETKVARLPGRNPASNLKDKLYPSSPPSPASSHRESIFPFSFRPAVHIGHPSYPLHCHHEQQGRICARPNQAVQAWARRAKSESLKQQ